MGDSKTFGIPEAKGLKQLNIWSLGVEIAVLQRLKRLIVNREEIYNFPQICFLDTELDKEMLHLVLVSTCTYQMKQETLMKHAVSNG